MVISRGGVRMVGMALSSATSFEKKKLKFICHVFHRVFRLPPLSASLLSLNGEVIH